MTTSEPVPPVEPTPEPTTEPAPEQPPSEPATSEPATSEPTPEPEQAPGAVAGVDPGTSPVPPVGAPAEPDVEVVETITDDVEVYQHPEPVGFATIVQDNVSEPGVQHTHSLQRTDAGVDMVQSSHIADERLLADQAAAEVNEPAES